MAAPSQPPLPRQWRYTWESLSNLPFLRLYLFNTSCVSMSSFSVVSASLRRPDLLVLTLTLACTSSSGGDVTIRVPVPRGPLLDPYAAVECSMRSDYIEVKLPMLLPVDHPVVAAVTGDGDHRAAPLLVKDDLKGLSSGEIHLHCRFCSANLTSKPLREFVEMPSWNWQDVADNWFGTCCCSSGGASEKLVSQYLNSRNCSREKILLEASSIIIDKSLLLEYTFSDNDKKYGEVQSASPDDKRALQDYNCAKNVSVDAELSDCESSGNFLSTSSSIFLGRCCTNKIEHSKETNQPNGSPCNKVFQDEETSDITCHSKPTLNYLCDNDDCKVLCSHSNDNNETSLTQRCADLQNTYTLGGGFLIRPSNILANMQWFEFLCPHCSELLGSIPSVCSGLPIDGRIRLFKCSISAYPPGEHLDVFRKHSLTKLFASGLLETAEDELSYRTVLKNVNTKAAVLQIVLLSSNAWCSTGYCFENGKSGDIPGAVYLRPVVKVLFTDCRNASEAEQRSVDDWSARNRAEEFYMIKQLSDALIDCLDSARNDMPPSCSTLQGMHISYVDR